MNREQFISALRKELSKLPPEEVVEATQYFEEIFEDATAGMDDAQRLDEEQRLAEEFGNPKKIAAQVKADYAARILEGEETVEGKKPGTGKKLSAVWWVIIGICSAPVSIPLAIGIICIVITLIGAIISLYGGIIAAILAGIAVIVFGFACLTSSIASGLLTIGGGLMLLAGAAAAAVGAFLGTKWLIVMIAKKIRGANNKRRLNKMAEEENACGDWAFTGENAESTVEETVEIAPTEAAAEEKAEAFAVADDAEAVAVEDVEVLPEPAEEAERGIE